MFVSKYLRWPDGSGAVIEHDLWSIFSAVASSAEGRRRDRLARTQAVLCRVAGPSEPPRRRPARPRAWRASRAGRARAVGGRSGPAGVLPAERTRVLGGHARRLRGAGRPVQRELPLPRRRARARLRRARSLRSPSRSSWTEGCCSSRSSSRTSSGTDGCTSATSPSSATSRSSALRSTPVPLTTRRHARPKPNSQPE